VARLENIAVGMMLVGGVMVGTGFWLGERNAGIAIPLMIIGTPVLLLGLLLLLAVGAASLGRRALIATGLLEPPANPGVPEPGWPGWQFMVDGVEHEVWLDVGHSTPRVLCDGNWCPVTKSSHTMEFVLGRHLATLTAHVDTRGALVEILGQAAVGAVLGGAAGSALPLRYDLSVGGTPVPDSMRLTFRQERGPLVAGAAREPDPGVGRRLRPDPPSH
jgi:hypothetical protein